MFGRKRSKFRLSRERAMSARPDKAPVVRREELEGGRARVTVRLVKPRWMRLLSSGETFERTFGLDALGREVYDACDGRSKVQSIIRWFAREHKVSLPEAELSVTTFLRTMLVKGLVVMEVDRTRHE